LHDEEIADTENCVGYMTLCTQFSVWKTAKASHLSYAVFHMLKRVFARKEKKLYNGFEIYKLPPHDRSSHVHQPTRGERFEIFTLNNKSYLITP